MYSRPDRLRQIAERFEVDPDNVLENVIFSRCFNSDTQMDMITFLAARFHEEGGIYRVLVRYFEGQTFEGITEYLTCFSFHLAALFGFLSLDHRLDHRSVPRRLLGPRRARRSPAKAQSDDVATPQAL